MHTEKKLSSELKYGGHIINVYSDTVELENGASAHRDVVRHKGAICVAPLNDKGELLFVRQFRYPIGRELLELPAGKRDSLDEDPLDCCHRELEEETGMRSEDIVHLGSYVASPGFCDEVIETYLARGLKNGVAHPDEDEFLDVVAIPLERAVEMVMNGEITDGKTQLLILKVAKYLEQSV